MGLYPTKVYKDHEDRPLPEGEFSDCTTAEQAAYGADLRGKTALVTGGTGGIGYEVARVLALRGARVLVAARSTAKGEAAAARLRAETKSDDVSFLQLDLSSAESIKACAEALGGAALHMLILNAGVFGMEGKDAATGLEKEFAINHMGHFALTMHLMPNLRECDGRARVVVVSSNAHRKCVDFDLYRDEPAAFQRYARSKLCNIYFARELNKQFSDVLWACSLHPGAFIPSEIGREKWWAYYGMMLTLPFVRSVAQGAATTVRCAVDERLDDAFGGRYFADCQVGNEWPIAKRGDHARFLWEESERLFAQFYE